TRIKHPSSLCGIWAEGLMVDQCSLALATCSPVSRSRLAVASLVRMFVTLITRRLAAMKPTVRRRITIMLAMSVASMMGAAQFVLVGPSVVAPRAAADNSAAAPLRIIIDSDFKTMND